MVSPACPDIAVVHLVWAPIGPGPLDRFMRSYGAHTAGVAHSLLVAFNGFGGGDDLSLWSASLEGVGHQIVNIDRPVLDLDAYRQVAERVEAKRYCFVNSYTELLVDGWLAKLDRNLDASDVGLVGVGGSLESACSSAPRLLQPFRRGFNRFPNPHLRTNGFMLDRDVMLDLDWPTPRSKMDALLLESGKRSISRQIWERGLDVRVVGRDGVAYSSECWHESSTFRSGGQRNLLIADNRTRQYDEADPTLRRRLERMAWGTV